MVTTSRGRTKTIYMFGVVDDPVCMKLVMEMASFWRRGYTLLYREGALSSTQSCHSVSSQDTSRWLIMVLMKDSVVQSRRNLELDSVLTDRPSRSLNWWLCSTSCA